MTRDVYGHVPSRLVYAQGEWWLETIVQIDGTEVHVYSPVGSGEYLLGQVLERRVYPAMQAAHKRA